MALKFYVAREGLDLTPVSPVKLRQLIQDGMVTGDDLVFAKHLKVWTKAREVKGFRTQISKLEGRSASPDEQAAKVFETSEFKESVESSGQSRRPIREAQMDPESSRLARQSLASLLPTNEASIDLPESTPWLSRNATPLKLFLIVVLLGIVLWINWPESLPRGIRVTGTVKFNGAPVESGRIQFDSIDGSSSSAATPFKDGAFEFPVDAGLAPGAKVVRIWGFRKTGKRLDLKKLGPGMENFKGDLEERESFIPAKFNKDSERQIEVAAGNANVFDFDLDDSGINKGGRPKR